MVVFRPTTLTKASIWQTKDNRSASGMSQEINCTKTISQFQPVLHTGTKLGCAEYATGTRVTQILAQEVGHVMCKQWKITQVWQFSDSCTADFLPMLAYESAAQQ